MGRVKLSTEPVGRGGSVAVATSARPSGTAGLRSTFLGVDAQPVNVLAVFVANHATDLLIYILLLQVCFLIFSHLLADALFEAPLVEGVVVGAFPRTVKHYQVVLVSTAPSEMERVHQAKRSLPDMLLAQIAFCVLKDKTFILTEDKIVSN